MASRRRAASPAAVTPMAFARAIVGAYRRRGRRPDAVLRLAQITPAALQQPDGRMTARQMEVLSGAAMQELDDEGLGAFARRLPWGSYGMLARASLSAPTLGVALKRWCRHHGLLTDDVALTLAVSGNVAALTVAETQPLPAELRELSLAFLLRNLHGLACWYVDSRIPLLAADFPFAAPAHAAAYAHMFPAPLGFGAPQAQIRFDAQYLGLPLRRDEKALAQMLQHALSITVRQYRRDRLLVPQVRQALAAHPERSHSAEALAGLLHVSPRTLHRQLKEEGASLQQLKDEVRLERAKDLLYRTDKPLKQVAAAVGFRNEKSFSRAFRLWTGRSPAALRNAEQRPTAAQVVASIVPSLAQRTCMETVFGLDATLLSRIQFAFTISFHIVFPAFSIGLSAFIATLEIRWLITKRQHLHTLARFWTKIFAVSFAMGVVSGIVMEYQLGTNWGRFGQVIGNTLGPLFAYEVLTAFFLEASFLGIMLFGWNRFPPWLHTMASVFVALGTALSGFWILAANSWMQTPAGFAIENGVTYPVSWFEIIFNPSFPYRFTHMMIATYITTSLVVAATGARYLLAGRFREEAMTMLRMGLGMLAIMAPLQAVVGDLHGLNTLKHQPAKIAAIEAHWEDKGPMDLVLFAWPDPANERNHAEIAIPRLGSLILTHDWNGRVKGLKDYPREDRPPVAPVFFSFRIMVGLGLLMIAIGWIGCWYLWRRRIASAGWFLRPLGHAWPIGFIALLAGWMVTEIGRQPWIAYGILRTADAVSPVSAAQVAISLALFVVVYVVVFGVGIWYVYRMIRKGPQPGLPGPETLPNRPLAGGQPDDKEAVPT